MADQEEAYLLRGKIQIDDSYLGGELPGGKADRGSENKIPILATVSLNEAGHPIHARITAVSGFSSEIVPSPLRAAAISHRHWWEPPQRSAAVPLDQHAAGQPQNQLQRDLPCLQL